MLGRLFTLTEKIADEICTVFVRCRGRRKFMAFRDRSLSHQLIDLPVTSSESRGRIGRSYCLRAKLRADDTERPCSRIIDVTGYSSRGRLDRNENILMYFRVSTVQWPTVIYVFEMLRFRVVQQDSQR